HAIEVHEIESACRRTSIIDLIDVEADAGLQTVIGLGNGYNAAAESPDREGRVARIGRRVVQTRNELRELLEIEGRGPLEHHARDNGSGHRHILRVFVTAAGANG